MTKEEIAIVSHKHNRIVFCKNDDYKSRHTNTHLSVYYHEFTSNGKLTPRQIRLPMDSENIHWYVYGEGE